MQSWKEVINKQIDKAIDCLKAAKVNDGDSVRYLKMAKRAVNAALALEEKL